MNKQNHNSSSSSNLSIDSLEREFNRKCSVIKDGCSEENMDTILVPFYEKDVLVKIPKEQKSKRANNRQGRSIDRMRVDTPNSSYLVNKNKDKRASYLEMFRRQIAPHQKIEKNISQVEHEIRSLSPEVGDTERESMSEEPNNPGTEFYNTESYNEIYYEKLLCNNLENYLDNSVEELNYTEEVGVQDTKSEHEILIENLKSVSEVSHLRRHSRRATEPPIDNVKLGGLGPDMERIKPRLERARSLQRYSEKVRMENRLKIYKKSVQVENNKKLERESRISRRQSVPSEQKLQKDDPNALYLINKSQRKSHILNRLYSKSKSADVKNPRIGDQKNLTSRDKSCSRQKCASSRPSRPSANDKRADISEGVHPVRAKSSTKNKRINTDGEGETVPPVHINFMVNVGGVKPSSTLKSLEEKHRMYQEQVKAFKINTNNL